MREAIRKRDKIDYNSELEKVYTEVLQGNLDLPKFTDKIKELFRSWK